MKIRNRAFESDDIYLSDDDLKSIKDGTMICGGGIVIQHVKHYPLMDVERNNYLKWLEDLHTKIGVEIRELRGRG